MAAIYGPRWTSAHETDEGDVWLKGLQGVSGEQLAAGLRECVARGRDRVKTGDEDWPPTLGEFRAMCLRARPQAHRRYEALPPPRCSGERIRAECTQLRKLLGRSAA